MTLEIAVVTSPTRSILPAKESAFTATVAAFEDASSPLIEIAAPFIIKI